MIYCNRALKKDRLYLLDTKERLYYPIAEWNENDREASRKWYEYLLSINDKIGEERGRLKENGHSWSELNKVEQIVPDEEKMIKDLQNDDWSVFIH